MMRRRAAVLVVSAACVAAGHSPAWSRDETAIEKLRAGMVEFPRDFPVDATFLPRRHRMSTRRTFFVPPFGQRELRWRKLSSARVRVLIVGRERVDVQGIDSSEESGYGFGFVLDEPERPSFRVLCRTSTFGWLSIAEGVENEVKQRADAWGIVCELQEESEAEPWRLALRSDVLPLWSPPVTSRLDDAADGALARRGKGMRVHAIARNDPSGFLFSRGDQWLGIWAPTGLGLTSGLGPEERRAVAAAAAALSVFQFKGGKDAESLYKFGYE